MQIDFNVLSYIEWLGMVSLICIMCLTLYVCNANLIIFYETDFTSSHDQLADFFTKPQQEDKPCMIRREIEMMHVFIPLFQSLTET